MGSSPITPDRIMQLGHAFRESKALLSAVELGVFTTLAQRPLPLETLREQLGINERGAHDFFDALVAVGMLVRHRDGRYANTPETDLYLDRNKPSYLGGVLEQQNVRHFGIWSNLTVALRTGQPQRGERAAATFHALYNDNAARNLFVNAMGARTLPVAKALAAKFPWSEYRTVVDVGCSQGCVPVQIAEMHPHIIGGGFDLPHLAPHFEDYVREHALSKRLRFYPGDFLNGAIPTAEVLILGRVLHHWDLQTKKMLLKKAYDALPASGTLVVYERLIDDGRCANAVALLSSLNMLLTSTGGFDFTGADCKAWMEEAGFHRICTDQLTSDHSMVVGIK